MGLLNPSPRRSAAGLAGLMTLTLVLVGWALKSNDTTPAISSSAAAGTTSSASSTASADPSSTPSVTSSTTAKATPTATGTAITTDQAAPLQTMLVALDNQRAWRISVGSCDAGGSKVETTTDGGTTWADAKAPLGMIVRVRPTDGQSAFVIGADSSCEAEFLSTSDAGTTWGSGSAVGSAWFRDPKDPVAVRAPGPATSQPCGQRPVLDLAVLSVESARVLCADGLVRSTADTGASWTSSGKASGAVALAARTASPAQTYVALTAAPGCAGVQVRRVDQDEATSCIPTAVPTGPGQIALSLVAGGGWLSLGDTTMRSTDNLLTWSKS